MKALALPACALLCLMAAPLARVQPSEPTTLVLIDSAAAVADPQQAIAVLRYLMPALERRNVACVDWQRTGTTILPRCTDEAYLASLFPLRSPAPGAMVSLAEAAAIEAHNEAIRDAVIQRECHGAADAHCGPRVHAAAVATLSNADADAQEKLAAVRLLVVARRPRRVVLITPSIPFKSEPSELKKLIAAVRDGRCELIVVRLPAATPPTGVLSDGVAKIEQRLTLVRTIALPKPEDVENAADVLGSAPDPDPTTIARQRGQGPSRPQAQPGPPGSDAIVRLHAYVTRFSSQVRFVVARERYEQQVRSRAGSYGRTAGLVVATRKTDADVTFANPAAGMWMMARSVTAVDGKPVAATPPSIAEASTEADAVSQIAAVAAANARWNIGGGYRTINTPTLVLWFMTDPVVQRFQLTIAGSERTAAGLCQVVRFVEKSRPPLLEVEHSRIPASGRVWILAESGAVVKTEMVLEQTRPSTRGLIATSRAVIAVDYSFWPATQLWVPREMTERYEQPDERESNTVLGTAQYSDYKLFRVGVRMK